MPNLLLHCGANRVERRDVEHAPTPERTRTWFPIPHGRLLNLVESTFESNGYAIESEAHALSDQRYFGLLELRTDSQSDDYRLVVGIRNSHDRTFPAGLAVGHCVLCCDNLAFSAEVTLARRHTRFIERDLPSLVNRSVGKLGDMRVRQDHRIEAYKSSSVTDHQAHDAMIRAVDARVLPVTGLSTVIKEWREPSHEEFTADGKTAWRLFNAFTESLKGRNLVALTKRSQSLHGLIDSLCGLAA